MEGQAPYIQFERVEVRYSDVVSGLRGVTLDIDQGEFVFLCGQTGSGKSTLIKCITKEVQQTRGNVTIAGRNINHLTLNEVQLLRREMGIVPQDFGLLSNKRVWENVAYALRSIGRSRREVRAAVPEILERVNILHRADAFPDELSGGEQQRVAIGRALVNNPPLLLADEPTGNLDHGHSIEIIELLAELNDKGATVIVATHDMRVVEHMDKRVIELEHGRLKGEEAADA